MRLLRYCTVHNIIYLGWTSLSIASFDPSPPLQTTDTGLFVGSETGHGCSPSHVEKVSGMLMTSIKAFRPQAWNLSLENCQFSMTWRFWVPNLWVFLCCGAVRFMLDCPQLHQGQRVTFNVPAQRLWCQGFPDYNQKRTTLCNWMCIRSNW